MSKIKHILFDCDGVLVDTEYTAAIKMCEALEREGMSIDLEHYLREHSGTTFSGILGRYFADSMSDENKHTLMRRVEAEVAAAVRAVPGIPELLPAIKTAKSVVSNSSLETVRHALKVTGIRAYFDGRIFSSEQVPRAKPAPDLYLLAIRSLGLNPQQILVVEDSRTGTQAARAAGLAVIGFAAASHILPGHGEKLLELGAERVAASTDELQSILHSYL